VGHYAFEATPVMADGTVFFSTPYNRVIALDAETGTKMGDHIVAFALP